MATPALAELTQTLQLMRRAALTLPEVASAEIDPKLMSLNITLKSGSIVGSFGDNLDRLLDQIPSKAERAVETLKFIHESIATYHANPHPTLTPDLLKSVYPVLNIPDLLADTGSTPTPAQEPIHQDFLQGLALYYVLDRPNSVKYLQVGEIAASGLDLVKLNDIAMKNLRVKAAGIEYNQLDSKRWVVALNTDGFYEGSFLLLPEIWQDLHAKHGDLVVAYGARGDLLIGEASNPQSVSNLRQYVRQSFQQNPHPVTDRLLLWDGVHWTWLD